MPQQDPENDSDNVFPTGLDDKLIHQWPSKNYKTTGEDDDASTDSSGTEEVSDEEAIAATATKPPPANTKLLHDFRNYCATHYDNFFQLTKEKKTCIHLMHVLKKRVPLSAYEDVLEWHLRESVKLHPQESLGITS